jgi:hypothetical protein
MKTISKMKPFFRLFALTLLVLVFTSVIYPSDAMAANEYTPLAPLPETSRADGTVDINTYIPNVVKLLIGIAGALAILRIIFGGLKYMTSEAFGEKTDAKDTINNAIIGLLLALSAYIILYTVNPKLVDFDVTLKNVGTTTPMGTNLGRTSNRFCPDGTPAPNNNPAGCGGTTINPVAGCPNCAPLPGNVPRKTVNSGGCAAPGPCVVDQELGLLLGKMATALEGKVQWQVTEMYPPKVAHESSCHKPGPNAGKCVDAAMTESPNNEARLSQFLRAIKDNVGPNFQYEIPCPTDPCTSAGPRNRLAYLQRFMGPGFRIVINSGATGEHAHINGPGITN